MITALYICLGLVCFIVIANVAWRFASRRFALPCPVWLRWLVEFDSPLAKTYRSEAIIRHLGLQPGMRVLDVGCGPGRVAIPAAKQVGSQGEVIAIDVQPGMIGRAREKAQAAGLSNIRFLQFAMGQGKLDVPPADRAMLVTVLGEIPDRQAAVSQIFEALRPGGVLSVTETLFDPHYQSRRTITKLACAAGFQEKAYFGNCLAFTINFEKPEVS
jgi:ubiquinone/menaquinone biosynthesis C-methylase UbiE